MRCRSATGEVKKGASVVEAEEDVRKGSRGRKGRGRTELYDWAFCPLHSLVPETDRSAGRWAVMIESICGRVGKGR